MKEQRLNIVGSICLLSIFGCAAVSQTQLKWIFGVALILIILIFVNILGEVSNRMEIFFVFPIFIIAGLTVFFWI